MIETLLDIFGPILITVHVICFQGRPALPYELVTSTTKLEHELITGDVWNMTDGGVGESGAKRTFDLL